MRYLMEELDLETAIAGVAWAACGPYAPVERLDGEWLEVDWGRGG